MPVYLSWRWTVSESNSFETYKINISDVAAFGCFLQFTLFALLLMHRIKKGLAWLSVIIKLWSDCWNWAETVWGCFLVFIWPLPYSWWVFPASVFTDSRFFRPFLRRSLGLIDLLFLRSTMKLNLNLRFQLRVLHDNLVCLLKDDCFVGPENLV